MGNDAFQRNELKLVRLMLQKKSLLLNKLLDNVRKKQILSASENQEYPNTYWHVEKSWRAVDLQRNCNFRIAR